MDGVGDDLHEVLQLLEAGGAQEAGDNVNVAPAGVEPEGAVVAFVGVAAARYQQRSPLLMQHARDRKEANMHKRRAEQAQLQSDSKEKQLKVISKLPMVARMLGRQASKNRFDEVGFPMTERLAFMTKLRGGVSGTSHAQAQACHSIASAVVDLQRSGILDHI